MRECGLKQSVYWCIGKDIVSLPMRECGLKHSLCRFFYSLLCHSPCGSVDWNTEILPKIGSYKKSLPMRECGLKPKFEVKINSYGKSLPMRECGLKQEVISNSATENESLPMRECGLKPWQEHYWRTLARHSPCGSVDWNPKELEKLGKEVVTPHAGVWIETESIGPILA